MTQIKRRLFSMQDEKYRAFQCRLMPTVDPQRVIGVRTPLLRNFAKALRGTAEGEAFLRSLPHRYYEEDNLHGFIIAAMKDFDACIAALDAFLPYVDNWATCDGTSPKVFKGRLNALLPHIRRWLESGHTYTMRFGIKMLMDHGLDADFDPVYPDTVAAVKSSEYYVNMMRAWYFATALAKQYEAVLPYIKENRLDTWTHNKAIQKAIESYRITAEQKEYLRALKRT